MALLALDPLRGPPTHLVPHGLTSPEAKASQCRPCRRSGQEREQGRPGPLRGRSQGCRMPWRGRHLHRRRHRSCCAAAGPGGGCRASCRRRYGDVSPGPPWACWGRPPCPRQPTRPPLCSLRSCKRAAGLRARH